MRWHSAEVEGLLYVFGISPPTGISGRVLHRVGQHVFALRLRKAEQHGHRGGRAEEPAHRVRAVVAVEETFGAERARHSRADVVAAGDSSHKQIARRIDPVGNSQRGRDHRAPRMGERLRMRVVGLVRVGEHATGQRRPDDVGEHRGAGDEHVAAAALCLRPRQDALSRHQPRPRDHRGDGVEDVQAGLVHHGGRQHALRRTGHVGGKALGYQRNTPPFTWTVWPVI